VIVLDQPTSTGDGSIATPMPTLERVRVRVQRQHIDAGGHTGGSCPIARAIGGSVFITKLMVRSGRDMSAIAVLPRVAREFVEAFDNGRPVEPIEFDLQMG
jgi:hypothetical protein